MASDSRTYRDVTRSTLEKLRAALAQANVPLPPGESGNISSRGFSGSFQFDAGAQTLQLTIDQSPPLVPKAMVWGAIDKAIGEARKD
ncbi:MAG: hypothetical protein DLM50_02960 [Candidatus Meridianibacter frigidus]|nr:MAG: hypothetical protein DLM50_02960 [Candidatus Eremiobacteraeota bacterium]